MAKKKSDDSEIAVRDEREHEVIKNKSIKLGPTTTLDLSQLTADQFRLLTEEYARGMLDVNRKAQELRVDAAVLDTALGTAVRATKEASKAGQSITFSHTMDSTLGRTEVILGNTETAEKGRLSRSARGERDNTLIFVVIGAIVAVVIIYLLVGAK